MSARMILYIMRILSSRIPDEEKVITILKAFANNGLPMAQTLLDFHHMFMTYDRQSMTYDPKLDKITYTYERTKNEPK